MWISSARSVMRGLRPLFSMFFIHISNIPIWKKDISVISQLFLTYINTISWRSNGNFFTSQIFQIRRRSKNCHDYDLDQISTTLRIKLRFAKSAMKSQYYYFYINSESDFSSHLPKSRIFCIITIYIVIKWLIFFTPKQF